MRMNGSRKLDRVLACAAVLLTGMAGLTVLGGCLADGGEAIPAVETPPASPPGWPRIEWPADNPYSVAKVALGKMLFYETGLSRDGAISCSWCHNERGAFADNHGVPLSTGIFQRLTHRNPPALANVAFGSSFMFDGSAGSLEEQALLPLFAENEMGMTGPEVEDLLSGDTVYVRAFREAFGPGAITVSKVAKALATYQRTLVSFQTPYDAWEAGDSSALSPQAQRGAALFFGERTDCRRCHVPPLFTDGGFHDIGLDSVMVDSGRARVTGLPGDVGKFKTPTLRNLRWTHPYMHDGRFESLDEVLDHYDRGGNPHVNRDTLVRPLGLSYAEKRDIIAFLESLTDQAFMDRHAL